MILQNTVTMTAVLNVHTVRQSIILKIKKICNYHEFFVVELNLCCTSSIVPVQVQCHAAHFEI